MNTLILVFPLKLINSWQFNCIYSSTNCTINIHIHNIINTTVRINNFLFNTLNYRIKFYNKIIKVSSNFIFLLNKSNKKKRNQKKIGRARVGALKSSMCRGGGVLFGPSPRCITLKINSKEWVSIYKSFIINRRYNTLWFYINKTILNYTLEEFYNIFYQNLGVSTNNIQLLIIIISKYFSYFNTSKQSFCIKNINLLKILLTKYLIYFI